MDILHEILKSIRSLGCRDEALCYAAYRVYVHLTEEKNLHDVQYHYAEHLREIYITAKNEPDSTASYEVFIPALATGEIDFFKLDSFRKSVELPNGEQVNSIVLAICDSNSTVLLYKSLPGLIKITEKNRSKGKLARQKLYAIERNK